MQEQPLISSPFGSCEMNLSASKLMKTSVPLEPLLKHVRSIYLLVNLKFCVHKKVSISFR